MIKKISKYISSHSQITLITSILFLIIFSPYYWDAALVNYIHFIFLSFIILSAILTLKQSGNKLKVIQTTGYILIVLTLTSAITDNSYVELVNRILFVLFFMLVAINLLIGIIKSKEVDAEVLFSAVAVYMLYGFCGAILTIVIIFFQPTAFSMGSSDLSLFHQGLYFSYITITTTGYGDILPLKPIAKTLAIFLTLFGQLYLTVIIGMLIGKYLSGRGKSN